MVFNQVQTDLEAAGYQVWAYVLPACAIDAPHRRDRIWFIAYADCFGSVRGCPTCDQQKEGKQKWDSMDMQTSRHGQERTIADTNRGPGQPICRCKTPIRRENAQVAEHCNYCGRLLPAHSTSCRGVKNNRKGRPGEFNKVDQKPNWSNWPTQSPVCNGNDGIPSGLDFEAVFEGISKPKKGNAFGKWRNESIMAGGNAIVPGIAHQIFKTIELYANQH